MKNSFYSYKDISIFLKCSISKVKTIVYQLGIRPIYKDGNTLFFSSYDYHKIVNYDPNEKVELEEIKIYERFVVTEVWHILESKMNYDKSI